MKNINMEKSADEPAVTEFSDDDLHQVTGGGNCLNPASPQLAAKHNGLELDGGQQDTLQIEQVQHGLYCPLCNQYIGVSVTSGVFICPFCKKEILPELR